eukprot:GFUD01003046.1.p1 GENE.GFUD01003046.1~~GFUD01003046.1.p1  ORF type:complete len:260 (+),score=58.89 GFUD01003046.1:85-864(+)
MIVLIVTLVTLSSVWCVQMQWRDDPDLVEFDTIQQGREHIKLMVAMVGETIDLRCQVLFASQPVKEIRWKVDGDPRGKSENLIVTKTMDGKLFIEDHLKINNITEAMDGSTVSCEYAEAQKGSGDWAGYTGRVEAVMHVFKLTIKTPEEVCETSVGNVQLVFEESMGSSPGKTKVDKRIRSKIIERTNIKSDELYHDTSKYSVSLPIATVNTNQDILDMKPEIIINGTISDTWPCICGSGTVVASTWGIGLVMIAADFS